MDLSNIKLREAQAAVAGEEGGAPSEEQAKTAEAAAKSKPKREPLTLRHQFVLSSAIPKKALAALVAKASAKAEQFAYGAHTYSPSDLVDPIFEDLIAPSRDAERFSVKYLINETSTSTKDSDDIFDYEPYEIEDAKSVPGDLLTTVDLDVVVNEKVVDGQVRAEKFVKKFGYYLDKIDAKYASKEA
ncbi:unnamed protein product [Ambrosiozyma monospora]|uniref:Unnamed protein product n=1 Tax=Ambrosiozyma monospora TaxID=43982 RepID=A0A9W6YYS5_AMBMO|nr:unnamed protein product [Ambrosiozyma monospora]